MSIQASKELTRNDSTTNEAPKSNEKSEYNFNHVSYCGLYCPKCFNMVVSKAAINLKKSLENTHICGSPFEPSKNFKMELDNLINLKCSVFCKAKKESDCPIRNCCISKNVEGCWECTDAQECSKLTQQFKENCKKISECGFTGFIEDYSAYVKSSS